MNWAIENVVMKGDLQFLAEALQQGDVYIISDGSYVAPFVTAAFVLETAKGEVYITNKVIAPGVPTEMSAYRGELTGIFVALYFMHHVCAFYTVNNLNT